MVSLTAGVSQKLRRGSPTSSSLELGTLNIGLTVASRSQFRQLFKASKLCKPVCTFLSACPRTDAQSKEITADSREISCYLCQPCISCTSSLLHLGGCQNYGPFLGTLNNRCRTILRDPKRDDNFDNHPPSSLANLTLQHFSAGVSPAAVAKGAGFRAVERSRSVCRLAKRAMPRGLVDDWLPALRLKH